jgi:hypothetical protein
MRKYTVLLVVLNFVAYAAQSYSQVQIKKRIIDGGFKNVHTVLAVDVDKDGRKDIVAGSLRSGLRWYKNSGNGNFSRRNISNFQGSRIYAEDVDVDGDVDVIAASPVVNELTWWENNGSQSFSKHLLEKKATTLPGGFESVFAKDLNGDGRPEILSTDWLFDEIAWWENKGKKKFSKHILDGNFVNAHAVHVADFNRDGNFDIIGSNAKETVIWLNNGNGGLSRRTIDKQNTVLTLWAGDIDGDGDLDITRMANAQNNQERILDWLENGGGGGFRKHIIHVAKGASSLVAGVVNAIHGDVDGDRHTDIVTAGLLNGEVNLWKNNGNENFTKIQIDQNLGRPLGVATLDFDKDGDDDIFVAVEKDNDVILYEVLGSGKVSPTLTVLAPNGGERWTNNTSQSIRWKSTGSINQVRLEYSSDNGQSWTEITASTPNDGEHNWSLPAVESNTCLIRISDAADGNPTDRSDAVFSIVEQAQGITLASPNGGERWLANSRQPIRWNSEGVIANVKLEFSSNNGNAWAEITASTPNDGEYDWLLPTAESNTCLIRVSDAADGNPTDGSDAVFSIITQSITLTSPNGGERWLANRIQDIRWNSEGVIANVKLEFSSNNGNSWIEIAASTSNYGQFSWRAPDTISDSCLVRVSAEANGVALADTSDNNFSILNEITSIVIDDGDPGYQELKTNWNKLSVKGAYDGDLRYIYMSSGAAEWRFELPSLGRYEVSVFFGRFRFGGLKDAIYRVIHAKGHSDFNFNQDDEDLTHRWQVLGEFEFNSSPAIVRIRMGEDGPIVADAVRLQGISGGGGPQPNPKSLRVVQPNGGEQWLGGSAQEIRWTSQGGITNIKLEYSLNNGQNWTGIIASTPNDSSYDWTVPDSPSQNCLIRVSDATNGVLDVSDDVFSIESLVSEGLTVTSPNGGERWTMNSTQNILWTSVGATANVELEYSLDNGSNWIVIIASTPNDGEYSWTVPDNPSTGCLIRVSDAENGTPSDRSEKTFSIVDADLSAIILDNLDPGYKELSGRWSSNKGRNAYGGGLRYSYAISALAEWQVNLPASGVYEVSIYFGYFQFGGFKDAVYSVLHSAGKAEFHFDQNDLGLAGTWNTLAEFEFTGSPVVIQISTGTDGPIVADAVRLRRIENPGILPKNSNFVDYSENGALDEEPGKIPTRYSLFQNYPNPFNLETQIGFAVPESDRICLDIYNLRGELVRTLLDAELVPGEHQVIWNGKNNMGMEVTSGIYTYFLRTKNWQDSKRLLLIK